MCFRQGSICLQGKCQRKDPPCKYLHPPQHLREQLLQNGRNNLILKSLQLQALHHPVLPSIIPMVSAYLPTPTVCMQSTSDLSTVWPVVYSVFSSLTAKERAVMLECISMQHWSWPPVGLCFRHLGPVREVCGEGGHLICCHCMSGFFAGVPVNCLSLCYSHFQSAFVALREEAAVGMAGFVQFPQIFQL